MLFRCREIRGGLEHDSFKRKILWPRPYYAGGFWKRRLHSGNASIFFLSTHARENRRQKSSSVLWDRNVILFKNLCQFSKYFTPKTKLKDGFRIFPCLKGVVEKPHFRHGLVWTVDLGEGMGSLRFQISSAECRQAYLLLPKRYAWEKLLLKYLNTSHIDLTLWIAIYITTSLKNVIWEEGYSP